MRTRVPDIHSVCCNAPVTLELLEYDFMSDTVAIKCAHCRGEVAGAALGELDSDVRLSMAEARWMNTYQTAARTFRVMSATSLIEMIRQYGI